MPDWRGVALRGVSEDNLLGAALLAGLLLLVAPLPGLLLDALLAANLALAMGLLLTAALLEQPSRFGAFPSWLVLSSLARVVLCLGVARAIVSGGTAGSLVETLGAQMTGNGEHLAGGLVLMAMLAVVAFVVLGLGVMRLAEVAARFALDALPGRQMAIDTALSSGRIDMETALASMRSLESENAFHGAMDGVARFLRGDAIACVVIAALVPLAAIGAGATEGLDVYLTSAIGLASMLLLPGILAGAAAALVLARCGSHGSSHELVAEVLLKPAIPAGMALALLALALVPGLAKAPLLGLAALAATGTWLTQRRGRQGAPGGPTEAPYELQLRLGLGLMTLLADNMLPAALAEVRARVSDDLGFAVPPFTIRDDPALPQTEFSVMMGGLEVSRVALRPGRRLVVPLGEGVLPAGGIESELPDGTQGAWLRPDDQAVLPAGQYHFMEPLAVLSACLSHVLEERADELFDLQRATEWLEAVQATHPASLVALEQAGLGVAEVREVGRALLREGVSLRERVGLIETLASARPGQSALSLAETVRPALARTITALVAPGGVAEVAMLGGAAERQLRAAVEGWALTQPLTLAPQQAEAWSETLLWVADRFSRPNRPAVVLVEVELRPALAQLCRESGAGLRVIQARELLPLVQVRTLHTIERLDLQPAMAQDAREGLR